MANPERLRLYRYVNAQEADDYLVIMSRFTDALLVEWSAADLADQGIALPVDVIADRCGFGTAETMRRVFQRRLSVAPDSYRRRFRVVADERTPA